MPLSKKRMRERKKHDRVKPMSNPNVSNAVKPIQGLIMEGNKILGVQPKSNPKEEGIPLYNPQIHRPGDKVMIKSPYSKKLIETTIPELDADGNPFT